MRFFPAWACLAFAICPLLAVEAQAAPFVPVRIAQCAAFSRDGALAALGSSGMSNGESPPRPHPNVRKCAAIQIWDAAAGVKLRRIETFGDLTRLAFTADGRTIVSSRLFAATGGQQMNEVTLWDVKSGKPLHHFYGCHAFALSPDGKSIVVLSRSRCVSFDLASRQRIREFAPLRYGLAIDFSPRGERLAGIVAEREKFAVAVCDASSGELVAKSLPLDDPFYSLDYSFDGSLLATGHPRGNVILWRADSLQPLSQLNSRGRGLQRVFFSPVENTLAAGDQTNGDVVFWNVDSGAEIHRYTYERGAFRTYFPRQADERVRPEKDPVRFAFSPDGAAFLAGCHGGIIRLVSSGQDVRQFGD